MEKSDLIRSVLQAPYKDGGRSPQEGFDCWGLVRYVLVRLFPEKEIPDFPYDSAQDSLVVAELIDRERVFNTMVRNDNFVGGIVTMSADARKDWINHLGIIVKPGYVLHAAKGMGVIMEPIERWRKHGRVSEVYEWPI